MPLRRHLTPPRLLLGSFLGLVVGGTLGLMWLPGLYTGEPLGWLDALFTATSAVCVTGLIVVDTATYFTTWGQALLLLLIQLGGLGMLTFTTLIIVALGRRLSLHHEAVTASQVDVAPYVDVRRLTRAIVVFTFATEAVGALILFPAFGGRFGVLDGAWHAVFHAISAFCNAGFSTFSDSLIPFGTTPLVLWVVMGLIVAGGLGFLTVAELFAGRRRERAGQPFLLSLHSRIALWTTCVLLLLGWVLFGVFEWHNAFAGMPLLDRLDNALFMSVTARTAGFNTVDYSYASDGSNFLTILLMAVGGSPGSTAGGMKTTTFALIGLVALARLRGRQVTSIGFRSVPEETIQRAVGLFVVAVAVSATAVLVVLLFETGGAPHAESGGGFIRYAFEVVSAFNTVGLSMGITDGLSPASRVLAILLMYLGRVGPLTFAAGIALDPPNASGEFRYAYEDVIIG